MLSDQFVYDVAFSFLAGDESLAYRLNELLAPRLKTFIYSEYECQKTLAGRDGEVRFNEVFSREARLVVVLYRAGWGDAGFSLVEQTAIRNRAFDRGWEFVVFIPLDGQPSVPQWVPKAQIWIGLNRFGVESAAAVIERCVQQQGGEAHEESIEDEASRTRRLVEAVAQRKQFLESDAAVRLAGQKFASVVEELRKTCESYAGYFEGKEKGQVGYVHEFQLAAIGLRWNVVVGWVAKFVNSLDQSGLHVVEWGVNPYARFFEGRPGPLGRTSFTFDMNLDGEHGWRMQDQPRGRFFSDNDVAEFAARRLLARIRQEVDPPSSPRYIYN